MEGMTLDAWCNSCPATIAQHVLGAISQTSTYKWYKIQAKQIWSIATNQVKKNKIREVSVEVYIHSFIRSFILSFPRSFIHSFVRLFVCWVIVSFIRLSFVVLS